MPFPADFIECAGKGHVSPFNFFRYEKIAFTD